MSVDSRHNQVSSPTDLIGTCQHLSENSRSEPQITLHIPAIDRPRAWVRAFRLKFLPQGVLPVALGSIVAWLQTGKFAADFFALALIGSACVQIGLTMLNDTLDYVYGTDQAITVEKNPFSGGSGVLTDGILKPSETLTAVVLFYLVATAIGVYLTLQTGQGVFWMALLGLLLSVFYSAKPLRFAYRGLGELMMLIGYGPTITLGAAYVQSGHFSLEAGLAGLVPGLLMWSMILVNALPDYVEDLRARKLNLTVRLGPRRVRWLYLASLISVYLFLLGMVIAELIPAWGLLALLSVPFAARSSLTVLRRYRNSRELAPANRDMVITYSTTMVLFCCGLLLSKI
jgi:1,4-dihydroxy-2-naphthoate octaprenyltransferase